MQLVAKSCQIGGIGSLSKAALQGCMLTVSMRSNISSICERPHEAFVYTEPILGVS